MSTHGLILYGIATFFTSLLSGAGGGGGGLIATPLAILLGLTPQQAIATGKLNGLAISAATIHSFRKSKIHTWRVVIPIMALAAIIGLTAPLFISKINNDTYQRILGVIILAMIPVVLFKRVGYAKKDVSARSKAIGYVLLAITLFMQAIFSSGMGVLVNLSLMVFMGMSALEANITKRYSQILLNGLIFIGVAFSHLVVWNVALVAVVGCFVGGRIGAHIALKKGDKFVTAIFVVLMLVSGVGLLLGTD
jgi:uncharacterized membrane protein YfcA